MDRVTAYLGLGSNLGQRDQNLAAAVSRLCKGEVESLRASSIYETAPWGYTCQPYFLNCVLEIRTALPPERLLESAKEVEAAVGRRPGFRYGPRLIDVDILLYGGITVDLPDLQIPHPRLHERAFALIPLAELAQGAVHPILRVTIAELASRAEGREGVRLWGSPPGFPRDDGPARP